MQIKEFRIVLPMTVEEYHVAQLWSIAEASRRETGGGDGVVVHENKPYTNHPILGKEFDHGQYTLKQYFFKNKVNGFLRTVAPKAALILKEEAWNAYPYCKTMITNEYVGSDFSLQILTYHLPGHGELYNVHNLSKDELEKREVIYVDIADFDRGSKDYRQDEDPSRFKSKKTGRGPLHRGWMNKTQPVMTAYKLVKFQFKKFGMQKLVEKKVMAYEERIFFKFHRQLFVWIDEWYGLTMEDVRKFEDDSKHHLDQQIKSNENRGTNIDD